MLRAKRVVLSWYLDVSRETLTLNERATLRRQTEAWGLPLAGSMLASLTSYTAILGGYREANVVGTRDMSRLLLEHVLDSLSCLLCEPVKQAGNLVDIGTGGGLPGIPLKLVCPDLDLTLIEATGKKTRFLEQAVEDLSLEGVEIVNERAENLGQQATHREGYDVATARAVASLSTLSEYCLPLVKKNGCLVAMKAFPDKKELEEGRKAAEALGGEISGLIEVEFLPEIPAKQRCLVVVTKVSETPDRYPRRPGMPKKSPLGSSWRETRKM